MAAAISRRRFLRQSVGSGIGLGLGGLVTVSCSGGKGGNGSGVDFFARGDQAIWKVFGQLRDEFKKQNPDIDVQIEQVPGDFYQKFQLKLASGTPPDSLFEAASSMTSSIRANALAPLDNLMKGDKAFNKQDYLPIAWLTSEAAGKTYGLPYDGGSVVIYYNLDLFEAAKLDPLDPKQPISWDQLLEYGQKLTLDRNGKRPGERGFDPKRIKQYGFDPGAASVWTAPVWVWGSGGEIITSDGKVPLDEPDALEGLQFVADLGTRHFIAPSPAYQQSGNLSFLSGNVAMVYDGVWSMVRTRDAKFRWDVAPFPTGKVPVSTGFYSPLAITAKGQDKEEAWKWISFCCSEGGQKIVSKLGQAVPPLTKLANSEVFLDPETMPQNKQVFLDQLDAKILRLAGDKMGKPFGGYSLEFGQLFEPVWGSVLTGKRPAAEAMKEVRPKLERLLETGKVS